MNSIIKFKNADIFLLEIINYFIVLRQKIFFEF